MTTRDDALRLLTQLNEWAALRGGPDVADSGEIGARIAELRRQLAAKGFEVVERDGRFELAPGRHTPKAPR